MTGINDPWEEQRRNRSIRTNAHLYIRHDAYRFMPPGSPIYVGRDVVKYFWPEPKDDPPPQGYDSQELSAEIAELLQLKAELAALRADIRFRRLLRTSKAFNPNQPRVPANNPDGGQWTGDGGARRTHLAAADKPGLGPAARFAVALELAKRAIEAYRSDKGLWDLFRRPDGAVTVTKINGEDIFGSNSTSPTYKSIDLAEATRLRDGYLEANPDLAARGNAGFKPNDGFYHAETTVLLRAARANNGTLAGQTLEVFGDKPVCDSCKAVLPFVGVQVGNPTVTFIEPDGMRLTMRDGAWLKESPL